MNSGTDKPSDADLMAAVGAGEISRLGDLFRRHHASVYRFLRRSSGSAVVAEDLTQDVFLRVLRYRSTFNHDHAFRPWLFRIARNVLADHFSGQRAAAHSDAEGDTIADRRPSPPRVLEAKERLSRVEAALASLSAEQRDALLLARFHDLSYREIAATLDCSEGAVKARVFRALRTLSARLDSRTESTR